MSFAKSILEPSPPHPSPSVLPFPSSVCVCASRELERTRSCAKEINTRRQCDDALLLPVDRSSADTKTCVIAGIIKEMNPILRRREQTRAEINSLRVRRSQFRLIELTLAPNLCLFPIIPLNAIKMFSRAAERPRVMFIFRINRTVIRDFHRDSWYCNLFD